MSIRLSDTQLVILSAAAQRDDRCLVAPQSLRGGAAQKVAAKLIGAGLVKEARAKARMPVWRRDEQVGQAYALKLTAAGAKAIAIDEDSASNESGEGLRQRGDTATTDASIDSLAPTNTSPEETAATLSMPRVGSKLAQVVELLQRDLGATLEELTATTGWLPHTTRAALTGLRKRGYHVTNDRSDKKRVSIYRIRTNRTVAGQAEAPGEHSAQPDAMPASTTSQAKQADGVGASRAGRAA